MINEPTITATCDGCAYEVELELTALARGNSYDLRDPERQLRHKGWLIEGDFTYCEDCIRNEIARQS